MSRTRVSGALVLLLAACGGDATAPEPPAALFPAVAGNYTLTAYMDGIAESEMHAAGTFSLQQPSRQTGTLTGTSRLTVTAGGRDHLYAFPLSAASITTDGHLTFTLRDSAGDPWTFTGYFIGSTVTGRHTLRLVSGPDYAGGFSATRQGQ